MDPKLRCNVCPIEDVDIPAIAMWSLTGPGASGNKKTNRDYTPENKHVP